jgi:hypothetical protein
MGHAHHWDHIFFLHRPTGGIGVLVYLWLLLWFGREAASDWKGMELGCPPWVYYFVLWAVGAGLGWIGAERRVAGTIAGGFVGLGGLCAVGLLRFVWPAAPDGLFAAVVVLGLLPGFVLYRWADQWLREYFGEAMPSLVPTAKTMPDILLEGGTTGPADGSTSANPEVMNDPASLLGLIDSESLPEGDPKKVTPPRPHRTVPADTAAITSQSIAAIVLGTVTLLVAAPVMMLAYTLYLHQYQGFRDGDRRLLAYGGYLVVVLMTVLPTTGVRFGMRGLQIAADAGEPEELPRVGVYLCFLAATVWLGCGIAWHSQAWPFIKP